MIREQIELQVIAALVAVACALPGVFLVLRRMALMSDAISHAILPGIVLAFFVTKDLASPLLVLGAALSGLAMVSLAELLQRTGRVKEDAAIGLAFPALFSVGVLLVSSHARNIHLDTDAVLKGDLILSVFDRRLELGGIDVGPRTLYVMVLILGINVLFIGTFWKELKLATFDPALAATFGLAPGLLHYGLMTLVSVTAVGAFDAAGSVLVVALMIGPPATAYLLTDRLSVMLLLSSAIGIASAVSGYWLANGLGDANIPGAMATMTGVFFGAAFLLAPERGLLAQVVRQRRQRWEFAQTMLIIHLFNHEGLPEAEHESRIDELHEHLRWQPVFVAQVVRRAEQQALVSRREAHLQLTETGRRLAQQALLG